MSTAAALPLDNRWRLSRLLTAPHRLGFFSAALMLATSALWWALALATRHAGVALPWAVPPPLAHGLVMAMGFMPLFIVGFLFTAGPRWLGLSLALAAFSHGLQAVGGQGLGLAPTHAMTMGYLGATLIAMITRVAAGHSGRPLAADNLAWTLYWALQAATLLRVAAAIWPAGDAALVLLAVAAWAAAATGWAWRYGGWLGRPRADGRPG